MRRRQRWSLSLLVRLICVLSKYVVELLSEYQQRDIRNVLGTPAALALPGKPDRTGSASLRSKHGAMVLWK